jgi:exosortase/archaeosortase family protein
LATVSLGVAEACSGLHSLSALLVGSLLLGFVQEGAVLQRVVLFLFSVPLAIAVNVVRVTGTAVLADHKPEFALGFYHAFSGWLVFTLGFAALWLTGKLLAKRLR